MKKIIILILAIGLTACASPQHITFQNESENTGSIIVQFSDDIKNVRATLNDSVIRTESSLTSEITILNVPPGEHSLRLAASSWELKNDLNHTQSVNVQSGQETGVIVSVPPKSGGYWAFQAVTFIVTLSILLSM